MINMEKTEERNKKHETPFNTQGKCMVKLYEVQKEYKLDMGLSRAYKSLFLQH